MVKFVVDYPLLCPNWLQKVCPMPCCETYSNGSSSLAAHLLVPSHHLRPEPVLQFQTNERRSHDLEIQLPNVALFNFIFSTEMHAQCRDQESPVCLSVHPTIRLSIRPSIHPSIHSSINSSVPSSLAPLLFGSLDPFLAP